MVTVAIIGPDGAGKSALTRRLEQAPLPAPVKRIYMGVNLEASSLMLPTTRLALAIKKARGRRPDMVAPSGAGPQGRRGPARRLLASGAGIVRLVLWMAEEWFRLAVAAYHVRRGRIVVFDRHFYADYFHVDAGSTGPRSLSARLHGHVLRTLYPKPDLVICLDAPGEVLFARKGEASVAWLDRRRAQYLQLADEVPHFVVVDVDRPLDTVTRDVVAAISEFFDTRRRT